MKFTSQLIILSISFHQYAPAQEPKTSHSQGTRTKPDTAIVKPNGFLDIQAPKLLITVTKSDSTQKQPFTAEEVRVLDTSRAQGQQQVGPAEIPKGARDTTS